MAGTVTTDEKAPALSPELASLQAQAVQLETETAAPPAGEPTAGCEIAAPVDYLADAKGIVDIAAESLAAFYPSTGPILNAEKRGRIAAALAPVMQKYGLDMGAIFGKFGPEIGLGFALAQVAVPIANAIRADRTPARKEQEQAKAPPPPAGPTAATTAAPPASDLYARA